MQSAIRLFSLTLIALSVALAASADVPAKAKIDAEIQAIQRRIEASNYTTERDLDGYARHFRFPVRVDAQSPGVQSAHMSTTPFYRTLMSLSREQRWLDVGAGAGHAAAQYLRAGGKAQVVALTVESQESQLREAALKNHSRRFKYLTGRYLNQYRLEELGRFDVVTDVFGALVYAPDLQGTLQQILVHLKVGGYFFSLLARSPYGGDSLTRVYAADGTLVSPEAWLSKVTCVEVIPYRIPPNPTDGTHSEAHPVVLRKTCDDVRVPALTLLDLRDGSPPLRAYRLD